MMITKPIELSETDAQQLYHSMEFAIKSLRKTWKSGDVKDIMSEGAHNVLLANMIRLRTMMLDHAHSFEP
jgi:hypothetical protein